MGLGVHKATAVTQGSCDPEKAGWESLGHQWEERWWGKLGNKPQHQEKPGLAKMLEECFEV